MGWGGALSRHGHEQINESNGKQYQERGVEIHQKHRVTRKARFQNRKAGVAGIVGNTHHLAVRILRELSLCILSGVPAVLRVEVEFRIRELTVAQAVLVVN